MTRLPMHEARRRPVQRNPRNPAYCETGHNPISGEHLVYGYRPGKSAHDALAVTRRRCWDHDWVLDLDIKSFFDEIDWSLLMLAVRRHTDCKWVLLYLQRWLEAPVSMPDGSLVARNRG